MSLCYCGCGEEVTGRNRYAEGHKVRGKNGFVKESPKAESKEKDHNSILKSLLDYDENDEQINDEDEPIIEELNLIPVVDKEKEVPYTEEDFKSNSHIKKILIGGVMRYYRKCIICGKRYYSEQAKDCPHYID